MTELALVQLPSFVEVITSLAPEGFTVKNEFPATGTLNVEPATAPEVLACGETESSAVMLFSLHDWKANSAIPKKVLVNSLDLIIYCDLVY